MTAIETVFKSLACINGSFLTQTEKKLCCSKRNSGVDIAEAEKSFDFISKMENDSLKTIVSLTEKVFCFLFSKLFVCRFGKA